MQSCIRPWLAYAKGATTVSPPRLLHVSRRKWGSTADSTRTQVRPPSAPLDHYTVVGVSGGVLPTPPVFIQLWLYLQLSHDPLILLIGAVLSRPDVYPDLSLMGFPQF